MSNYDLVIDSLLEWMEPVTVGERVLLNTLALYPSNSCVKIGVFGSGRNLVVSDESGAVAIAATAHAGPIDMQLVKRTALQFGLKVHSDGSIFATVDDPASLAFHISLVSNCSQKVAELLTKKGNVVDFDYRTELDQVISSRYHEHFKRDVRVLGSSNKPQRFDFEILLRGSRVFLDAVKRDSSSINSAIVAHLDVRANLQKNDRQAIIYDKREMWSAEELSLLKVGATPIEYASFQESIERIAA
jgi:hypothetical protein